MAFSLRAFFSRLILKLSMTLVVGAVTWVICGLWLFTRDQQGFEARRTEVLSGIAMQVADTRDALANLANEEDQTNASIQSQIQRIAQTDQLLKTLHKADPTLLKRVLGDSAEVESHEAQIARIEALKIDAQNLVAELQRKSVMNAAKQVELSQRMQVLTNEQTALQNDDHALGYYMRTAWSEYRWLVVTSLAVYLFGGFFTAFLLYYFFAPRVMKGRALQLSSGATAVLRAKESTTGADEILRTGEVLRVRKHYLQAKPAGLKVGRCWVLNWRIPIGCWLSGLTGWVELRNDRSQEDQLITLGNNNDPFAEMTTVTVPESGLFVLRAGYLMGIISPDSRPSLIRRKWSICTWQSWVTGRFGYWEFQGPCRLIVSCVSPLRAVTLNKNTDGSAMRHEAVQAGVVGFSPQLSLKPLRCRGFWRYYYQRYPLFGVEFTGLGLCLSSELDGRSSLRMGGNKGLMAKWVRMIGG